MKNAFTLITETWNVIWKVLKVTHMAYFLQHLQKH